MNRKVIVTTSWDDGHVLDLKLAKLLLRYGIRGTFYISPNNREFIKSDLLTDSDIIAISKNFEIGSHTLTHPRLSTISYTESRNEIVGSKRYLESLTHHQIVSFCYPGGDYTSTHVGQVRLAGFKMARTTKRFAAGIGENQFEIPTSIHAYKHWSDVLNIASFVHFRPEKFIMNYTNWDTLAINFFDYMQQSGGVFHLWGHSWELEKKKNWNKLERVLAHVANRNNVTYETNANLV